MQCREKSLAARSLVAVMLFINANVDKLEKIKLFNLGYGSSPS